MSALKDGRMNRKSSLSEQTLVTVGTLFEKSRIMKISSHQMLYFMGA